MTSQDHGRRAVLVNSKPRNLVDRWAERPLPKRDGHSHNGPSSPASLTPFSSERAPS
jgi:hypothetical protein